MGSSSATVTVGGAGITAEPKRYREAGSRAAAREGLVRLAVGYATLPAGPAGLTATSVTSLLEPYLEGVLADAG